MKITEDEYAENRRLHRWITQKTVNDLIKLAAGIAILILIRLLILYY